MLIAYVYVLSVIILAIGFLAAARKRTEILAAYVPAFLLLSLAFAVLIVVLEG